MFISLHTHSELLDVNLMSCGKYGGGGACGGGVAGGGTSFISGLRFAKSVLAVAVGPVAKAAALANFNEVVMKNDSVRQANAKNGRDNLIFDTG